jgi:hypothetical protein
MPSRNSQCPSSHWSRKSYSLPELVAAPHGEASSTEIPRLWERSVTNRGTLLAPVDLSFGTGSSTQFFSSWLNNNACQ